MMMNDDLSKAMPEMRHGFQGDPLTQMKTPFTNSTLHAPEGLDNCGDLHCELVWDPDTNAVVTVSGWDLTDHQREMIAAGAHMRMSVWQHPIPPLALSIEGPFCEADEIQMVYIKTERQFACPACGSRPDPSGTAASLSIVPDGEPDEKPTDIAEAQVRRDFEPAPEEDPPTAA